MRKQLSRREMIALTGAMSLARLDTVAAAPRRRGKNEPFRYCLNTSTISGQKLTITEMIDVAGTAGYDALEPWIRDVDQYVQSGGSLKDLAKRIRDNGLTVESSIGFAEWIVDDDARRAAGLEQAKRDMDRVAQIGGLRMAAPPVGATDHEIHPHVVAERYRALLELGGRMGVVPEAEVWGFSRSLGTLGSATMAAIESGHPKACVLPDVFHLYKGGSAVSGLRLLRNTAVHCFHLNDYPADPPRERISDAQRVYPGDGVAPLDTLFRELREMNYQGVLSLELFNREYWKQDPLTVAKTGLEKMRAAVRKALA